MKRIISLGESDLTRIVKKVISENKIMGYSFLYEILPKTKLYKLLDDITKVKTQIGSIRGGLRLVIYNQDGTKEDDLSLNDFNISKTKQFLRYKIDEYLTDEMVDELRSIQKRRRDPYMGHNSNDITDLITIIINIITNRKPKEDTLEDIFDRHYENKDWCAKVHRMLDSGEISLNQIKENFFDDILYFYAKEFIDKEKLKMVVSKKINNCID